jgi:tetratricopeptide (TPR) repeat protein
MRRALLFALALAVAACGGQKQQAAAPVLPPANPQALTKLAQGVEAAREPGGKKRAQSLFQEALGADQQLWEARYNLGVLEAEGGDLKAAEAELEKAHALAPNAEDVAVALSEVRRRAGDHAGAIEVLKKFVQQNPQALTASVALVTTLREGGKVKESIDHAHAVLVRQSSDPYALSELALAHLELGELDTAELISGEALKAGEKSAAAYRAAALVALKRGDDAIAFRHFVRATELDPNDTTARLNMAIVLLKAGIYDRAAEELRAVLAAEPENTAAALGLAAARRAQGSRDNSAPYAEAEKLLKGVLEREPKNLSATFNLGVLYAEYLKKPSEAEPLLKRFLDEAPEKHSARAEAQRLLSGKK